MGSQEEVTVGVATMKWKRVSVATADEAVVGMAP